jgi:protease-4
MIRKTLRYTSYTILGLSITTSVISAVAARRQRDALEARPCVLEVDLTAQYMEHRPDDFIGRVLSSKSPVLPDLVYALHRASSDPVVETILARGGACQLGVAQVQEVRDALKRCRAAGKQVVLVADSFDSTKAYYLAAAADRIVLHPVGDCAVNGVGAEPLFFKRMLQKYGLVAQVEKRAEYKNAMDMLVEDHLTEPHRENIGGLLTSIVQQIGHDISSERSISLERLESLFNTGFLNASVAMENKLVDRLGYFIDMRQDFVEQKKVVMSLQRYLKKVRRLDTEAFNKTGRAPSCYIAATSDRLVSSQMSWDALWNAAKSQTGQSPSDEAPKPGVANAKPKSKRIAVVTASGNITREIIHADRPMERAQPMISDRTLTKTLSDIAADPAIVGVVLRIDSPGGSYIASDTIAAAMQRVRAKGKPIVLSMGNVAASGGYYLAAAADLVVANPATITGSIGVITGKVTAGGLLESFGVTSDSVQTHPNALALSSLVTPWTENQLQVVAARVDEIYGDFLKHVAKGRKLTVPQVHNVARGRVWTGRDALNLGLVDKMGGLIDAVEEARRLVKDENVVAVHYPYAKPVLETLAKVMQGEEVAIGNVAVKVGLGGIAGKLLQQAEIVEDQARDPFQLYWQDCNWLQL